MTPWVTAGIIRSIKFRDKLYKKLKTTNISSADYQTIKINLHTYNSILQKSIRAAKKSYYSSRFEKFRSDIHKNMGHNKRYHKQK